MYFTPFFEEDMLLQQFVLPRSTTGVSFSNFPGTVIVPVVASDTGGGGVPIPGGEGGFTDNELLAIAMLKTGKAAGQGFLIASLDGPVPVMDVFGFIWASYKTVEAWEEYRVATQ